MPTKKKVRYINNMYICKYICIKQLILSSFSIIFLGEKKKIGKEKKQKILYFKNNSKQFDFKN